VHPHSPVLVDRDGTAVPGMLLKASEDGGRVLVTFEQDGHVSTIWLPADQVRVVDP
jgi:hypothetical protein